METAGLTRATVSRVPALDYLRGLAALAVLFFHYEKWVTGVWQPGTFLGKSGVYAVSVFFVLSGLTLTLVYRHTLPGNGFRATLGFWVKRAFRIFPLLWMATAATLVLDGPVWTAKQIIFNFTGLFGLLDPAGDIALGAWSIGNELVYYLALPLLLWLAARQNALFWIALAGLIAVALWFAFRCFPPGVPLKERWFWYVHPADNAFFFVAGVALGFFTKGIKSLSPAVWRILLFSLVAIYAFYPIGKEEPAALVSGWNRVGLSALCIGMVTACFGSQGVLGNGNGKLENKQAGWAKGLQWLGEVSYSVYLLHPLVFRCLKSLNERTVQASAWWLMPLGLAGTLVLSHFSYNWLEKPAMRFGARLSSGLLRKKPADRPPFPSGPSG